MVENRSFEMSVEMLPPSSTAEVYGADAGGTMQWQSCHKEHPMFRVSAPPKPQTPGPSRPAPPSPHARRSASIIIIGVGVRPKQRTDRDHAAQTRERSATIRGEGRIDGVLLASSRRHNDHRRSGLVRAG